MFRYVDTKPGVKMLLNGDANPSIKGQPLIYLDK